VGAEISDSLEGFGADRKQLLVEHGDHQRRTVRPEAQSRWALRQHRMVRDAALQVDGLHEMRIEVGEPESAPVPSRPLWKRKITEKHVESHAETSIMPEWTSG
jgi:hypothetical protein